MGWLSNKGAPKNAKRTGPKRIAISSIQGGHSPDKRKANAKKKLASMPPIEVEYTGGFFRPYRLIDGTDRVHYASEAGHTTIRAYVWKS